MKVYSDYQCNKIWGLSACLSRLKLQDNSLKTNNKLII